MSRNYYAPAIRVLKRWKGKYTQEEILKKAKRLQTFWGIWLICIMIFGLWALIQVRLYYVVR